LLLGGTWLFVAPWALGTGSDTGSSSNAWTLGLLVAATAWWALARPADKGPAWLQALYGVWLFVAPWLLGFAGLTAAAWNAWLVGVGVAVLAVWVIAEQASIRASSTDDHLAKGSH
jgi:hypothetical protein